jgi:nicotinate phosphoribosyltransferase
MRTRLALAQARNAARAEDAGAMNSDPAGGALLTDLYELTMLQAYFDGGMQATASFELFSRKLPAERGFLLAAGLEQAVQYLEALRFEAPELDWLAGTGRFTPGFLRWLADLRFTGDVWALPEGTACFADEPLLRVTAPLPQAQLVESRLLNLVHFQTVVASKAARCVLAAPGKLLVDFGLRRSHGAEAGLLSARASHLAGFSGTATALAGLRFGVPVYGTMAHSFVQAHDDELLAFERFARAQAGHVTLLIDTYDTEAAAAKVVALARRLAAEGIAVQGVRIDSGDLAEHARRVRRILDDGGLDRTTIFASGNLDEHRLAWLEAAGAPIDGYGVGTRMNTSADAPFLDCAYKLVAYDGRPRRKRSEGKATWPGAKQVWRRVDAGGRLAGDVLALEHEVHPGEPLLRPVMRNGRRVGPAEPLEVARERARAQLAALPAGSRGLREVQAYPVTVSPALHALAARLDATAAGA